MSVSVLHHKVILADDSPIWEDSSPSGMWPTSATVWLVAIYMALFIIRPWEKMIPEMASLRVERVYAAVMIAATILSGRIRLRCSTQTAAVLFNLAALAICSATAVDSWLAWPEMYKYCVVAIFYLVFISVTRTPRELIFLAICYLVIMGAYLGKAEWEYFVNGACSYRQGVVRMIGIERTFGSANMLAASIVYSLPRLYFAFACRRAITADWPGLWRRLFTPCLAVYLAAAVGGVILTRSRSGALALLAFLALVALRGSTWTHKIRNLSLVAAGCVLFFFLGLSDEARGRLSTIWDSDAGPAAAKESFEGRWAGFAAGVQMFADRPLHGVGVNNYLSYRIAHVDGVPLKAHNLFGELLGETGLLGALGFLAVVGVTLWNCRRTQRLGRESSHPTAEILSQFSLACRDMTALLLFEGLGGHNLMRFHWLWIAAFSVRAYEMQRGLVLGSETRN
ncbi:MAG: O-antigen ligase family protein [Planctomycetales bacterium]